MSQNNLAHEDGSGPAGPDDALYDALVTALRSNARGRAFLGEYARRARQADTMAALAALARIETLLLRQTAAQGAQRGPVQELWPDDAYVPFEFEPLPDATEPAPGHSTEVNQVLSVEAIDQVPPPSSADLLAQVMALSPEERIALFS
jgi:hypothetical protein